MNPVWLGRSTAAQAVVGSVEEASLRVCWLERRNPSLLSDLASGLDRDRELPIS